MDNLWKHVKIKYKSNNKGPIVSKNLKKKKKSTNSTSTWEAKKVKNLLYLFYHLILQLTQHPSFYFTYNLIK